MEEKYSFSEIGEAINNTLIVRTKLKPEPRKDWRKF